MSKLISPYVLVPQNNAIVLERFGKFYKIVEGGLHFKIPFIDYIAYHHSLKEQVLPIEGQNAITRDNVKLRIDGVLYFKIDDPKRASYEVKNPVNAISLLAQTSMRSEIGKIELDRTFEERESLNAKVKEALNHASEKWGIRCMRYEIKDIKPPELIRRSMELQAESERIKRSKILESEGEKQARINVAEGEKMSYILKGEGDATKILQDARGVCESLDLISKSIVSYDSIDALKLKLVEGYIDAMGEVLEKSKIVMIPDTEKESIISSMAALINIYRDVMAKDVRVPADTRAQNVNKLQVLDEETKKLLADLKSSKRETGTFFDDKILYSTDGEK